MFILENKNLKSIIYPEIDFTKSQRKAKSQMHSEKYHLKKMDPENANFIDMTIEIF
jgi:hypothetical protein